MMTGISKTVSCHWTARSSRGTVSRPRDLVPLRRRTGRRRCSVPLRRPAGSGTRRTSRRLASAVTIWLSSSRRSGCSSSCVCVLHPDVEVFVGTIVPLENSTRPLAGDVRLTILHNRRFCGIARRISTGCSRGDSPVGSESTLAVRQRHGGSGCWREPRSPVSTVSRHSWRTASVTRRTVVTSIQDGTASSWAARGGP